MNKNKKDSLKNLKDALNSLLSSKKLMAAVLAPLTLALVACPSGNEGDGDRGGLAVGEVVTYSIESAIYSGSAKTKNDVLNALKFIVTNSIDEESKTVPYAELKEKYNIDLNKIEIRFDPDTNTENFPADKENITLTVLYDGKEMLTTSFANGNYVNQSENENKNYTNLKELLPNILGEKYNEISEEVSTNITLTAQTIDAVTDTFSVLNSVITAQAEDEESKMNEAKTKVNSYKDNSEIMTALVAQNEGRIGLTKQTEAQVPGSFGEEKGTSPIFDCNIYDISVLKDDFKVSLSGKFDYFYNHIGSLKGNIDISKLEIVSHIDRGDNVLVQTKLLKEEIYDKFNLKDKDGDSLPTLNFGLYNGDYEFGLKHFLDIYDKYNKSKKLNLLNIEATFKKMDGSTLIDNVTPEEYTLFEGNGNTAKTSNDKSIKSFEINKLKSFADNYGISTFKNLIISGTPDKEMEVDWDLTNIIFEENMNNLKNTSRSDLKGIVYFKKLPYNNSEGRVNIDGNEEFGKRQGVNGVVKLDTLDTLDTLDIFKLNPGEYSVIDLSNIDKDHMMKYNPINKTKYIFTKVGSVYFNANVKNLKENGSLYIKFIDDNTGSFIYNEYFGDGYRADSLFEKELGSIPSSLTPRKLSEFEYYGNKHGDKIFEFKTPAYNSYKDVKKEWEKLSDAHKSALEQDIELKKIAKVDFVDPDTKKIILSVLKDRQYNV